MAPRDAEDQKEKQEREGSVRYMTVTRPTTSFWGFLL
jgi:hypothetical protein